MISLRTCLLLSVVALVLPHARASSATGTCTCTSCFITDEACTSGDAGETACSDMGGKMSCSSDEITCKNFDCSTSDDDELQNCDTFCGFYCDEFEYKCQDDGLNSCFHEDTVITYKGQAHTLQDLLNGHQAECSVPHTPASRGVRITTSCGKTLRVTDTHLVATSRGFQLAYSLRVGDIMYGDFNGSELCKVESIGKEKEVQRYFGLNCLHSEVLADGLRTSTFGDFHTLPSWYMYYAGNMLGVETASKLGDYIAEWYLNL